MSSPESAPLDEIIKAAATAKETAAAAAENCEGENTIRALEEIGMPVKVKPIAESNIDLANAVLVHCQFRFAATTMKPIGSKTGYIVSCFTDPEGAGFNQDDDLKWHTPPGEPPSKSRRGGEHPRVMEELQKIRNYYELSSDQVKRVEAFVRERAPLFATATESNAAFRSECVAIAFQWKKEGKL
jgi:hypothetical protein